MTSFIFTPENLSRAERIVAKYPAGRQASAALPLLDIAQRQNGGWLSKDAIQYLADYLGMPLMRLYEVASFYTMFNLKPVGKHLVQLCRTTPCWLRGSDAVKDACKQELHIGLGETTPGNDFTLMEVECLGACVNAPVVQINDDYYEDLNADSVVSILRALKEGKTPPKGSQTGRQFSAPAAA